MGYEKTVDEKSSELKKLLSEFGIDLRPTLRLSRRDSLYAIGKVQVQEVDLTSQVFDAGSGGGASPRRSCSTPPAIDLGGSAVTDDCGKRIWKLSDFVCDSNLRFYSQPVSFVATALSETPVSMTVSVQSTGFDLGVKVFSWDASGAAAPRVAFSWRCWAEANPLLATGSGPARMVDEPE